MIEGMRCIRFSVMSIRPIEHGIGRYLYEPAVIYQCGFDQVSHPSNVHLFGLFLVRLTIIYIRQGCGVHDDFRPNLADQPKRGITVSNVQACRIWKRRFPRVLSIVRLKAMARGGEGKKSVLHVNQLVKEMGKIIGDTFPKSIQCRVQDGPDSWPVHGLPTQLHQVIMNLCINARDAMAEGGTLTLATANVVMDEAQAARHRGAAPGRYLCFSVSDTGIGIPEEQLSKIFQPFFTTKAPGQGTGLGLSTSLTIVKNHGGFMTVQSAAGNGTEFKVFLPAVASAGAAETPPDAAALPAGNGEGILIVDDEEAILVISKTTLENYRYRVRTAASGLEAVAIFTAERDAWPLVITDEAMPFMDGTATILALRKIRPDLKVIITSGHERRKEMEAERRVNADAFIEKPFTVEKLLTTVHDVLAKKT